MISTFCRADRLALATLFQSKEETRYYLNGVFIQAAGNDGVNLVTTDGHRMAVFHDGAGLTGAPCIVPLPKIAIDIVRKRKTREFCWFGIVGEHTGTGRHECRIFDTTDQASELDEVRERMLDPKDRGIIWNGAIDLIDGTYPEWARVVPKQIPKNGASCHFNGKLFADFTAVAKDRNDVPSVMVYTNGNEPSLVTCGRDDFVGVLMPMQGDERALREDMRGCFTPSWLHP
jgi:hypothetical protein